MGGEASVWNPRTVLNLSADTKRVEQRFTASAGQTLFTITAFTYAVGTGSLAVYQKDVNDTSDSGAGLLAEGVNWSENTSSTFSLSKPCEAGDTVIAVGYVAITAAADVRDTDIFVANYQALRDYAGVETTLWAQGKTTAGDGGEYMFTLRTGEAPGFFVDDGYEIIVPTGGDGSSAWTCKKPTKRFTTVANFQAARKLIAGDYITIDARAGGKFLLSNSGVANGWNVIYHTNSGLYATLQDGGVFIPKEWGCVGDGVADDKLPMQAGLDTGYPIVDDGTGLYRHTGTLTVPAPTASTFQHFGIIGKLRLAPSGAFTALSFDATLAASTTLSASTRVGRESITVTSGTGISTGDILVIESNKVWPYSSGIYGECNMVGGISGTTVTVATPVLCEYIIPTDTVTVKAYKPKTVTIDRLEIVGASLGIAGSGIDLYGVANCDIGRVRAENFGYTGVSLNACYNVLITPTAINCYLSGYGYGVQTTGCTHVQINGGVSYKSRHGVDFSGNYPSHLCSVVGMTVVGHPNEGSCLGSHGPASNCSYIGNTTSNSPIGFQCRGPNSVVLNNVSYGHDTFAYFNAPGFMCEGNRSPKQTTTVSSAPDGNFGYFIEIGNNAVSDFFTAHSIQQNTIKNNNVAILTEFIRFSSGVTTARNLDILNNTALIQNNSGGTNTAFISAVSALTTDAGTVRDEGNTIISVTGTYQRYRNFTLTNADTVTNTAACSLTTKQSNLVTTGAAVPTLADGYEGQEKVIYFKTDGGNAVLTPTNLHNGTTITFANVGESATLLFTDGGWLVKCLQGAVLA